MSFRPLLIASVAALLASANVSAQEYDVGSLHISAPHARPSVTNQRAGGAYVTIENKGKAADRLVAASSPVAQSVELHTMAMDGDVMRMREVPYIELKPSEKIEMVPGKGYHLMLMDLKQPLKAGDKFPLSLTFEKAGKTEISVSVDKQSGHAGGQMMQHGR